MLELTIGQEGFDNIRLGFDRLIAGVKDLRPAWPEVSEEFHRIERKQFSTEGEAGESKRWGRLSPAYKEWKDKAYPGKPILELTGALRASLLGEGAATITSGAMFYSEKSNVEYGIFHTFKRARLDGTSLFRPPVALTDRQSFELIVPIRRYVQRLISESFKVGAR